MPELPEVQTVVNHLAAKITGKVFSNSQVKVKKMISPDFEKLIKVKRIKKVSRRGKMIVIALDNEYYLLIHLKMTGQLIFVDKAGRASGGGHPIKSEGFDLTKPNKFTHIILNFKDRSRLLFHDVRKFGWMKIVKKDEGEKIFEKFGIEPLDKDFTLSKFTNILKRYPKQKIKQLLLHQELIAGIGNIYADESLFKAGIKPTRIVKSLSHKEIKELHQAIKNKLKTAIKYGGTSVNTFVSSSGERGGFVKKLLVYGRGGQECLKCGKILTKIKINGRGTVYCPNCQK